MPDDGSSHRGDTTPRLPKALYEAELRRLQAQLVDMQAWVQATGARTRSSRDDR